MNRSLRSLSRRYAHAKRTLGCRWTHVEDVRPSPEGRCVRVRHALHCRYTVVGIIGDLATFYRNDCTAHGNACQACAWRPPKDLLTTSQLTIGRWAVVGGFVHAQNFPTTTAHANVLQRSPSDHTTTSQRSASDLNVLRRVGNLFGRYSCVGQKSEDIHVKYPKFHGDGYLALPVLRHAHKEFDILIEFKPRDWNGLLLYTAEREEGKGDYFSIALVNGFIVYRYSFTFLQISCRFDCGTGHATIRSANRVQLDKWNWVRVSRRDNLGSLWLNDVGPSTGYSQGAYSRITIRLELYLGGFFNVSRISRRTGISKGFIGCIQTLKINNYQYDLRSAESYGEAQHGKEVHIPKFGGFSHLRHPGLGRSSLSYTQIEMVFKPTHPEGVILYNGYTTDRKGDYISLAMRGRHLEFQFDLGTGPGVIKSFEPLVLDQWHWVQVSRTGMQGVMEIDKQHRVEGLSQGAFTQLTLTQDLLIGGHHNFDETSKLANLTSSFRGCIQSIIINDKELDLVDDADFGVNIEPCDHPCVGDPCLNSGQCLPDKEFYTCSCPLGFGGSNCQNGK
ncbi:hypothetical protein FSP39_024318 [Pinctada imbricata]|uniref:Pikachurin n=1 Tax=Pinctada imbricata TaxID=66713 RepID=A0AA88XUG1_PINIB|nr:hypothetical protein FSP39_024318 [Pinctada imbricata]